MESKLKVGDVIVIDNMHGEVRYTGKEGKVTHIDDIGQVHGTWGGCALIPELDKFHIKG